MVMGHVPNKTHGRRVECPNPGEADQPERPITERAKHSMRPGELVYAIWNLLENKSGCASGNTAQNGSAGRGRETHQPALAKSPPRAGEQATSYS